MISKIYNWLKKKDEDLVEKLFVGLVLGLAFGLDFGLALGLVFGLAFGLASGLALGLDFGLAFGLVFGLAYGLVYGLVVILINLKETLQFLHGFIPITLIVLGVIVLVELIYWLSPKEKLKKGEDILWKTIKKKLEALSDIGLIFSFVYQIYFWINQGIKYLNKEVFLEILKGIGYIGAGLICLALIILILCGWIKLNSLKWRK